MDRRNIILITLDSLRADHCSFMGYKRETTPTIDRMCNDGLCFINAYSPSTATPTSMIGIFTGDHSLVDVTASTPGKSASFKPWRDELSQRKTLAEVLSQKGYFTAAFTPNAYVSRYFGFDKGFRYFQDFIPSNNKRRLFLRLHRTVFKRYFLGSKTFTYIKYFWDMLRRREVFKPLEDYYDEIIRLVEKIKTPFFLWILILDTHYPFLPPKIYRQEMNFFTALYYNLKYMHAIRNPDVKLPTKIIEKIIELYDSSIRYADSFIDKIWKDLRTHDPVFIIHADHGEAFGEHCNYGHPPFLYEENIHVPFVVFNTNIKGKVEMPVSLLEIPRVILQLAEEKEDFLYENIFDSENLKNNPTISMVIDNGTIKIAIRDREWKFITGHRKREDELYNLQKDPQEQQNLIFEEPSIAIEMEKTAREYLKSIARKRLLRRIRSIRKEIL